MEETKQQFNQLLEYLADALDIPDGYHEQTIKRYEAIGAWLNRPESTVSEYNPDIYPQGSFALGTAIKPITDDGHYDIDIVCELYLSKDKISQKDLKRLIGTDIISYALSNGMNKPADNKRCWTLQYSDKLQFHLDILPAIPDALTFKDLLETNHPANQWASDAVSITDKQHPDYDKKSLDWYLSNPRGYRNWFISRMSEQVEIAKQRVAESKGITIEEVPDYTIKTPLQRAIQVLKRSRDIMFKDDEDGKPISIIITTLAAHAYNNEANLLETLLNITQDMQNYIELIDGTPWVSNPVFPLENFADKWQENPKLEQNFRKWLEQVALDIRSEVKGGLHEVASYLKPKFGDNTVKGAMERLGTNYKDQRKQGALKISTATGTLGKVGDLTVEDHTFYGEED